MATLLLAPLNGSLTAQDRSGATAFVMTSGNAPLPRKLTRWR